MRTLCRIAAVLSCLVAGSALAQPIDLAITNSIDSPDPMTLGTGNLTYTLTFQNATSSTTATNVVLSSTIPAASTYVSATPTGIGNCNQSAGVVTCSWATLGAFSPQSVVIVVTPTAGGTLSLVSSIDGDQTDPVSGNDNDTENTVVNGTIDLQISSLSDNPANVTLGTGDNVVYSISTFNASSSKATNPQLVLNLPASSTYVTHSVTGSGGACNHSAGVLTCTWPEQLPSNTFNASVTVTPGAAGTNTLTASLSATQSDPNLANNSAAETTTVNGTIDLQISSISDNPTNVTLGTGDNVVYSISTFNASSSRATNPQLVLNLPASSTYVTHSVTGSGGVCNESTGVVTCTWPQQLASNTFSVSVTVTPGVAGTNTLTASLSATQSDPNTANNSASESTTVNGTIDLQISSISDNPTNVTLGTGDNVVYSISTFNASSSRATNPQLVLNLPASSTYVTHSVTGSGGVCNESAGVVTCTWPQQLASNTFSVSVTVTPGVAGTNTLTASLSATQSDPNLANNSATETTTVNGTIDLQISSISDNPTHVTLGTGDNVVYSISTFNASSSRATNPQLVLNLPASSTYVTHSVTGSGGVCNESAGVVTCTWPQQLASNTFSVSVTVTPGVAGTNTLTASLSATQSDPNLANNSASESTTVNGTIDLQISSISDNPTNVTLGTGDNVVYSISTFNASSSRATNPQLVLNLPASSTYVTHSVTGAGGACNHSAGVLTCTWPQQLASNTFSVSVTVTPGVAGTNTLTASLSATQSDPNLANNSATETTTVNGTIDLQISSISDNPTNVTLGTGDNVVYSVSTFNASSSRATNPQLVLNLPASSTYVTHSVTGSGGACNHSAGVLTCTWPQQLASNTFSVSVTVTPGVAGTNTLTASLSATQSDPNLANNSATETTTVNGTIDLQISSISDNPTNVTLGTGDNVVYSISTFNASSSRATNPQLVLNLPASSTYVTHSVTGAGGACNHSAGVLTCTWPQQLASNTFSVSVTVMPGAPGTNTLTANLSGSQTDPTPANNSATETTNVNGSIDLAISSMSDSPTTLTFGSGNVTYSISTFNGSSSRATNPQLTVTLPAAYSFVSASATGAGSSCGHAAGVVTCTWPQQLASNTFSTSVVVTPTVAGIHTVSATVSGTQSDPNTANNSDTEATTVNPNAAPVFFGFTPASGPINSPLTINGANFTSASAVKFTTNVPATFTVVNDSTITTSVPAGAATGTIAITNGVGTANSGGSFTITPGILVVNTSDSGTGSLRDAMTRANNGTCASPCTIQFAIGSGAQTITPASALPIITAANAAIDGTTQPGYSGTPIIGLNGSSLTSGSDGIVFTGSAGLVRAIAIQNFAGVGAVGAGVSGSALGVRILGNSMSGNTLGIDLGMNGPTANDAGDADSGANGLQNYPAISSAIVNAGNITLTATVDSPSTGSILIEVFRAAGTGEGEVLLGSVCRATPVTSDVISVPAGATTAGQGVVATATSYNGAGCSSVASGTSEFSPAFTVTGCTPPNAAITAPTAACAGTAGLAASVGSIAGATYAWTITNGTITSATNTNAITFTAGAAGTTTLNVTVTDVAACTNTGTHNVTVNSYPAATITAPSNVCASATGQAASVPSQAGATYAWSITNGTITSATNANAVTFTAGPSGTTTLNVTVTTNACATNGSHNVTIDPVAPASISGPASACANTSGLAATVSFAAGATYGWTITNGIITSASNANSITFTAGPAGTTTLNVTVTLGGCTSTGTHAVSVTPLPPSTITAPATTCPNTAGLTASVPVTAGASYAWTITNGSITSATNTDTITFTAGASGATSLGVTITDGSGCVSSSTHTVTINANPVATITAPSSVCAGATGNTASVPAQGGATYAWTITNGTLTGATTNNAITFTAGATGTTSLNVTITNGSCAASGSHNASIAPAIVANVTAPAAVCAGSSGHTASVNPTGGATYSWSITNGTLTAGQGTTSITFAAASAGTAVVGVAVTAGGCSTSGSANVGVNAIPSSTITAPSATCPSASGLTASVPAAGGATYAWTIVNGAITSANNVAAITFTAGPSGTTTLNVTVTANGCASSASHNIAITANPAATISAPATACASSPGNTATVSPQAGATYAWTITNGAITSSPSANGITFSAGASGTTTVSVTVTANGCTSTGSHNVAVTPPPNTTITVAASVCANSTANAASVPAQAGAAYTWSIANGAITSASNANAITFDAGPSGNVVLNVNVSVNGCANGGSATVPTTSAPTLTITAPPSTCPNTAGLTASVPAAGGATYGWSITNGAITSASNTNAITFTAGASGSTTLNVTVTAGCTSTATHNVTIVANPAASIAAPASVCANATGNSATAAAQAGATYAWSITNGAFTGPTNSNAVTFTAGASGNVTLGVTVSVGSCTSTGSATVPIVAALAVSITGPASVCPNTPFTLDAGPGFTTYAWSNGAASQTINVAQFSATTYSVTVTNGSCSASASKTVAISSAPLAAITAPATVDASSTGNLASVAAQAGAAYVWSITNGTITAGQNTNAITFTAGAAGTVDLHVVVTIGACTAAGNASAAIPSAAGNEADLMVTKSAPATVNTGQTFTYTIAVINNGPINATNVSITDDLPAGLTLLAVNSGWPCTTTATTVRCSGQTAIVGPNSPIEITVRAPSQAATITNTVSIGSATADSNPSNNSASATTQVVTAPPNCGSHALPHIIAPTLNAAVTSPVTIQWTAAPQAVGYRVWMVTPTSTQLHELGATNGATSLTANIAQGQVIIFIEALFTGCPSTESPAVGFNVLQADPCAARGNATLLAPANGAVVNASSVELRWSAAAKADGYRLFASINGAAAQVLGTTEETSLRVVVDRGQVVWWVQALFDGCPSTESARFRFTIPQAQACADTRPSLLTPAHDATVTNPNVAFSWSAVDAAVAYELWLTQEDGVPTLFATTTATSITREVPQGDLEWFVRVRVDRCDPRDSQKSRFTYTPPASCANDERPTADAPAEGAEIASPASFRWSVPPGATRYELYVIRGSNAPVLAGSSTTGGIDNVSLAVGRVRWFVRAFFGANCPPLDSVDQSLTIVPTPDACGVLEAPVITAPGQISSNVPFRIRWSPIAGATSYQLLIAADAAFANPASITTTGTEHELTRTNDGNAPVAVHARVRAIDARCTAAPSLSPYGPTTAVFILPTANGDPSVPASSHGLVTFTIPLGPGLAGQTFTAVPTQPWLTVTPASGVVGPTGTKLTVIADTATLPLGASLGGIVITTTTPATNGIRGNATTTTTKPITISLVSPVTPANRNTPPPDALIIPAVANADGINAHFQSDVRVSNASAQATKYQLTFTPSEEGLTASKQTQITIDPGRTIALDDVLETWFGTGGVSTTGTLEVRPLTQTAAAPVVKGLANLSSFASSRTFNATSNGTFGQYIPAIPFASFVGKSESILSLQQIAQSAQYRTNLGLLEASGEPASLLVTVFGPGGTKLTSFPVELKGGQHTQLNSFLATKGITSLADGRVEVQVTSGNGKVTAYASVLDNATADPLLVTPVSLSDDGNTKWVVPGVADLNNGLANWQTDLRVFNASTTPVDATLSFYSQNGGEPKTATITIPAGQVREFDKTLTTVFNAPNDGGAVHISTPTSARLIATARTYNQTTAGTYGQFISAVTPLEAAAVGTRALQLLQVEESTRYRSNIGLAEVSGKPVKIEVSMITPDAKTTAFIQVDLGPNEFRQLGGLLRALGNEVHNARITVKAISGDGRVAAYASVIDMTTQDPTYLPAQ